MCERKKESVLVYINTYVIVSGGQKCDLSLFNVASLLGFTC